eukprot:CAMPEP_0168311568 /NCGR_PEP_ID=MMETSP0142_2-20121227/67433_1 /TAXON_ID=44445 /ORGANISM="Pseudo-nitzschia australis, Strain 10249 10 AB" /LENGTH=428 /DNA_ID=CAMNT_0008264475 /DNA_START=139 /DNA_END=1425 /DNA_ORIENTATION=-
MDSTSQIPMGVPNPLRKKGDDNVSLSLSSSFPSQGNDGAVGASNADAKISSVLGNGNKNGTNSANTTDDHAAAEEDRELEGPSKKRQRRQLRRITSRNSKAAPRPSVANTTTTTTTTPAVTEKTMVASSLKNAMEELDRIWDVDESSSDDNYDYDDDDENTVDDENNSNSNSNNNSNNNNNSSDTTNNDPDASSCDRVRQTAALLVKAFSQELYDPAIRALSENEELRSRTTDLTNQLETSNREVERLKRSEQRSKESIQNLLKAVDRSTEETKDSSQTKLVEAKLRAELLQARKERDVSHHDSIVAQRSLELTTAEADAFKQEKTRLKHENSRLEREARSARSLAESLSRSSFGSSDSGNGNGNSNNTDYYKRKAQELEIHLQGMTARLVEKNQELLELRHSRDRNLSQNRLEALRASGASDKKARF